jgi:hypothetical protein
MAVNLSNPHLQAVFARAGMPAPPRVVAEQLDAACADVEGHTNAVLEISHARWATENDGEDVLAVLMRTVVVLVAMRKRGIFSGPEPHARAIVLADYQDVAKDDEFAGPTVWFLAHDEDKQFLLKWPDAGERDRMFRAIFSAHAGRYEQWGIQLDPANYVLDFDRYYAQIAVEGPSESGALYGWVEQRFGEFDHSNALGFAQDWRRCVLEDATRRDPSSRVARIGFPSPWIEAAPEARRVVVRLGEGLFDEGLLDPPYDERTFDTGEPISHNDAGPARLIALMTLAAHAEALGHPRAATWIEAARTGIPKAPQTVFSDSLRTLWSHVT